MSGPPERSCRPLVPPCEIEAVLSGMRRYFEASADPGRQDRLWPSDFMVFMTNPLSIAYGACGSALFLNRQGAELRRDWLDWLTCQRVHESSYPPGLFLGSAGIAYAFLELGLVAEAEAAAEAAYRSDLLFEEPGLFLGVAGWGLVSLWLYQKTGTTRHLEMAERAGRHLVPNAETDGELCFWRCRQDGRVHYGFGASGIALFLAYLFRCTGDDAVRRCALAAMEYDLAHQVETATGPQWRRFEGDPMLYPYWIHGSAGVASVLVRLARLLDVPRYRSLAEEIAEANFVKYTFSPCVFEGLAGIGETMLDLRDATGDERYDAYARDIAETLLWFCIEKPEGIAYPGRWMTRISSDYGTGAAGVGLFLDRLVHPGPRHFLDFDEPRANEGRAGRAGAGGRSPAA